MQTQSTRFASPVLAEQTIKRRALIKQLECIPQQNIIYINAPAGYGKTTLAAEWLYYAKKSAAWLTLDEYSASPSEIYKGVLLSLTCQADEENNLARVSLEYMLSILSTHKVWPQAFVIDDFHLSNDVSVSKALPMIRARFPRDMIFIVISRNPPHDVLADLIVKGLVKQITGLQFEGYEIIELFSKNNMLISKLHAELLKQQTDGWAAALSAIMMANNYKPYYYLLDQKTLNFYLKSNIFEFYDNFDIIKKCSISDVMYPSFCEAITGQDGAWEVIEALAKKTGLITRLNESSYRFHTLLREFLYTEMERDDTIDRTVLYINAANWFMENGDRYRALHMVAKSGDISKMEKITRAMWGEYGSDSMDMGAYIDYIDEYLLAIPNHISRHYPLISIQCFHGSLNCRPITEVFYWLDVLEDHMIEGRYHEADYLSATFMLAVDPRRTSWHVPKQFEKLSNIITAQIDRSPRVFSLSQNLPFFHKAQRDYTDITTELTAFTTEIEKQLKPFLGPVFMPLALLLEAGVIYETGDFDRAEQITSKVLKGSKNYTPEISFCAYALHFEILRLMGKSFDISNIGNIISQTKANYLIANFNAYETDSQLYNGDKAAAVLWLKQCVLDDILKLYKVVQYFTTARAMIVLGMFSDALRLLDRLFDFSRDFRRNADYVEVVAMQSICYWNMSRHNDSVIIMSAAIKKAMELQIITPISKYGNDIMPILKKILNRQKRGYDNDILDKSFVNKNFIQAKAISKHVRGMLSKTVPTVMTLSPRQKQMLDCLAQNLTYQEISDKTGIKITTVRDHIEKLYEKLDVSTSTDAVIKARELGM